MKDKTLTAILALFLGVFGVHRFYLRQNGLGVLYFFLMFVLGLSLFLGIIDFFIFLFMDKRVFDIKYNERYLAGDHPYYDTDFDRNKSRHRRFAAEYQRREEPVRREPRPFKQTVATVPNQQSIEFQKRGMDNYRNYDYAAAIEDFKKALSGNPKSVPLHFNIACAYSLTEQEDQAFFHLSKAVEHGLKDFDKIRSHEALAYLRLQDEFDTFSKNGYRLLHPDEKTKEDSSITSTPDLLEQLKQLGELRERGLLTEDEFLVQKKKLLG